MSLRDTDDEVQGRPAYPRQPSGRDVDLWTAYRGDLERERARADTRERLARARARKKAA